MKKKIKVGIDFDGVLAYNPFRLGRAPVTYVKRKILGAKKTTFYIPQTKVEKFIWMILHESSVLPAAGVDLLKELVQQDAIEAHLVTARYSFLQESLFKWLKKNNIENTFTSITMNDNDQQPHLYKEKIIQEKKFDYFIEDNFDIVKHIAPKSSTKMFWIYNIIDRWEKYPYKYPYLQRALEAIKKDNNIA